jgi:hypothetical protein
MICVEISENAFEAIPYAVPLSGVAYEAKTNERGERLVWLSPAVFDRLFAMRRRRESCSDVILRLAWRDQRYRSKHTGHSRSI